MSCKKNILIIYLFAILPNFDVINSEWVEIPQFSDESKIYRLPFTKYDHGEKYFAHNSDNTAINGFGNTSKEFADGFRRITIVRQPEFVEQSAKPNFHVVNTSPIALIVEKPHDFGINGGNFAQLPVETTDRVPENVFEDEGANVEVDNDGVESSTLGDEKIVIDGGDGGNSGEPGRPGEEDDATKPEDDYEGGFLAYMPMELFKKVHATLKSQPTTVKGKLSFLKRFEITLLAEIEKRLVPVINPVRRKRESRGDHGWDDNEESIGFPSLEGALMAISFLTFAVYLVQMVMMLFRNLGNTANPINSINTGQLATVLLNRNKRSDDEFTEQTARILHYIDKFAQYRSTMQ